LFGEQLPPFLQGLELHGLDGEDVVVVVGVVVVVVGVVVVVVGVVVVVVGVVVVVDGVVVVVVVVEEISL